MRGAQPSPRPGLRGNGIIPADAGSTAWMFPHRRACWDHPRRCGEHAAGHQLPLSSPDHPRRCGEHRDRHCRILLSNGSSPQMRGALLVGETHGGLQGIIPADAGSTKLLNHCRPDYWDHPRRCGEHPAVCHGGENMQGSSPQMRGAPPCGLPGGKPSRIIPADAGSTRVTCGSLLKTWDHPRRCGEHKTLNVFFPPVCGSSPQMRGALQRAQNYESQRRIIPADAGSTPA